MICPPSEEELDGIRYEIEQWHKRPNKFQIPKPFLLLHQEQEESNLLQIIYEHVRSGNDDRNLRPTPGMVECYRRLHMWRHKRLVETYNRFILGRLDLAGRHPHRWALYKEEFERYIADVDELKSSAVTTTTKIEKIMDYEFPIEEHEFHDEAALERFMNRWNLHREAFGRELVLESLSLSRFVKQTVLPPRFQTLNFLDFPQEITEQVYDFCNRAEVVALAHTCRGLYASGYSHLLRNCCMAFSDYPLDRRGPRDAPEITNGINHTSRLGLMQTYIDELRDWLVKRAQDLVAQPDKCKFIRKMTFDLECAYVLPHWIWNQPNITHSLVDSRARRPAMHSLFRILPITHQLQSLTLKHLTLDADATVSLCSMEHLQALTLDTCLFVDYVAERVRSPGHGLSLPVPNLYLRFESVLSRGTGQEQWNALCFCPSVVNLSIVGDENELFFPSQRVSNHWATSFGQLEYLYVNGLDCSDSNRLFRWVDRWREANPNQQSALTHLKWEMLRVWTSDQVIQPLCKLLSPMIKVLCVDGLPRDMANRSTIELIRRHAPNLQALTLSARETKPSWRFADLVGTFPCLEHFEWNYRIPTQQATPVPLLAIEKHELEGSLEGDGSLDTCAEALDFDDYHLAAAPFAAFSSSLRTWVANRGAEWAIDEAVCLIHRTPVAPGQIGGVSGSQRVEISHIHTSQIPDIARWDVEYHTDYPAWPNLSRK
ncbi:hypothetical protein BKA70DRAFT_1272565 [Coprinopsis sp. MPI-PUGE-AT-0042]|nr:hypothetical protein BKA70DRAFT_1272565 [Coprinopsis sp. MPI-PUGE-AT-0042]